MEMHEGMKVDVIDASHIYCPASILSVSKGGGIKVRYLGWGKKYDDVVTQDRIEPAFSKVLRTRGWVYLDKLLPLWPCVVYLRTCKENDAFGMESLELEPKVFVMPFGQLSHRRLKPYS